MAFQSFEQFWPFYLSEHRRRLSRRLHATGTLLAIGCVGLAIARSPLWLIAAPVCGYAPAWIGHFLIERNRPATFKHPFWSLRGDFRMLRLMLTGRLDAELGRHGLGEAPIP